MSVIISSHLWKCDTFFKSQLTGSALIDARDKQEAKKKAIYNLGYTVDLRKVWRKIYPHLPLEKKHKTIACFLLYLGNKQTCGILFTDKERKAFELLRINGMKAWDKMPSIEYTIKEKSLEEILRSLSEKEAVVLADKLCTINTKMMIAVHHAIVF